MIQFNAISYTIFGNVEKTARRGPLRGAFLANDLQSALKMAAECEFRAARYYFKQSTTLPLIYSDNVDLVIVVVPVLSQCATPVDIVKAIGTLYADIILKCFLPSVKEICQEPEAPVDFGFPPSQPTTSAESGFPLEQLSQAVGFGTSIAKSAKSAAAKARKATSKRAKAK